MKDTLSSINSDLKIKTEGRDRLYYDRYKYVVSFDLQDAYVLKLSGHQAIDDWLDHAEQMRINSVFRWSGYTRRSVTEESRRHCHHMFDFLQSYSSEYKSYISMHWVYLYTNDLDFVTGAVQQPGARFFSLKQAHIDRPRNSVKLKKSDYSLRTYFGVTYIDENTVQTLRSFIENNSVKPSPTLQSWLLGYSMLFPWARQFFIDYNEESIITLLSLSVPVKLYRTVDIIVDK